MAYVKLSRAISLDDYNLVSTDCYCMYKLRTAGHGNRKGGQVGLLVSG